MSRRAFLAVFSCIALALSCAKEESAQPPIIGDPECQGATCVPSGSKGSSAGRGGAEAGGASGAATGGLATVRGQVVVLADPLFASGLPYPGRVEVVVDQATPDTSVQWDGSTPFALPGVPGGLRQFRTSPIDPTGEILGALVTYRVTAPELTDVFPVVDGQVLRTIVASLPTPQTLVAGSAHALLSIVDAGGAPIAGLTATASGAGAIGYDLGDDYTGSKTGPRGAVLLVNVSAASTLAITLTDSAGLTKTVALPIVPNVVTFAGAQL